MASFSLRPPAYTLRVGGVQDDKWREGDDLRPSGSSWLGLVRAPKRRHTSLPRRLRHARMRGAQALSRRRKVSEATALLEEALQLSKANEVGELARRSEEALAKLV